MPDVYNRMLPILSTAMLLSVSGSACDTPDSPAETPTEAVDGITALYIGHSFGRPFASELTDVADAAGIDGHTQEIVKRGGENGSPHALWNDREARAEVLEILDSGEVDVMVMICCSPSFLEDGTDPAIRIWMDEALAVNPDTRFVLTLPWPDFPEEYPDAAAFSGLWYEGLAAWHTLIESLRTDYPGVQVTNLPHGRAALELRNMYEDGMLDDVDTMTSEDGDAIFVDAKGHADEILLEIGTLVWLGAIYDIDPEQYPIPPGFETDLVSIAAQIVSEDDYIR
jgi:hypothetical protein